MLRIWIAAMHPGITQIESVEFAVPLEDGGDGPNGVCLVYDPGSRGERNQVGLKTHTDIGVTGEYVGGSSTFAAQINVFADYLLGKTPLHRERICSEVKRPLHKSDRMGRPRASKPFLPSPASRFRLPPALRRARMDGRRSPCRVPKSGRSP